MSRRWLLGVLAGSTAALVGCGPAERKSSPPAAAPAAAPTAAAPAFALTAKPLTAEEGKKLSDRGLAAVKEQNWSLAARCFAEAQKADPWAPAVLFNLGLAEAKAGREVLAAAWLESYLGAQPEAANREAVRAEIGRLETAAAAKMGKVFDSALAAAKELKESREQDDGLIQILLSKARVGDLDGAEQVLTGLKEKNSYYNRARFQAVYAESLAEVGNFRQAEAMLEPVAKDDRKYVYRYLSGHCLQRGDLAGARKYAAMIEDKSTRDWALQDMIRFHLRKDDYLAADDLVQSLNNPNDAIAFIVAHQLARGDEAGAAKTMERLDMNKWMAKSRKGHCLEDLALAQVKRGDLAAAKTTVRQIMALGEGASNEYYSGPHIVAAAVLGNYPGAIALARQMKGVIFGYEDSQPPYQFGKITFIQTMAGDLEGAKATAKLAGKLADKLDDYAGWPDAGIARALALRQKFPDALSYAAKTKSWARLELLPELSRIAIKAGDPASAEGFLALLPLEHDAGRSCSFLLNHELAQAKVEAAAELAEAYAKQKQTADALRVFAVVGQIAAEGLVYASPEVAAQLEKVAARQAELGDAAGEKATRALLAAPTLRRWVELALSFAQDKEVANLEEALKNAASHTEAAKDLPSRLGWVAQNSIGKPLLRIRALREQP